MDNAYRRMTHRVTELGGARGWFQRQTDAMTSTGQGDLRTVRVEADERFVLPDALLSGGVIVSHGGLPLDYCQAVSSQRKWSSGEKLHIRLPPSKKYSPDVSRATQRPTSGANHRMSRRTVSARVGS